jgi:hypothetical protein
MAVLDGKRVHIRGGQGHAVSAGDREFSAGKMIPYPAVRSLKSGGLLEIH